MKKYIIMFFYNFAWYRRLILKEANALLVINKPRKTVMYYPSPKINAYAFVVLLKHFSDKSVELDYWLEIVPMERSA